MGTCTLLLLLLLSDDDKLDAEGELAPSALM